MPDHIKESAPLRVITGSAKAIVAGASVAVVAAIPLADAGFTLKERLIIAGAFLAGGFPTWVVPNRH